MSASVQPKRRSASPLSARMLAFSLLFLGMIGVVSFVLFEISLRIVPYFIGPPLSNVLLEADRIALCNTRLYGGTSILLPTMEKADLLVVGDSFPFGTNVRQEASFPAVLAAKTGKSIANLGVPSRGPNTYNRMIEVGMRYQPKEIFYFIFANDIVDIQSVDPIARPLSIDRVRKPLPGDRTQFVETLTWRDHLRTLRVQCMNLSLSVQLMKIFQHTKKDADHLSYRQDGLDYMFMENSYWDPRLSWSEESVRNAVPIIADYAAQANAFCQDQHIPFTVFLIPTKEMTYGPFIKDGDKILTSAHEETYQHLAESIAIKGIRCIDLTPVLRERAKANRQIYFPIDGHFNEEGNREMAGILEEFLNGSKLASIKPSKP